MVKIMTDSSSLYKVEEAREKGFESVALSVTIGDWDGRDLQMDMEQFYAKIREGQIPRSSQPPIGEVLDLYEAYPDDEIINITMADGLSGTYQSACSAREMVDHRDRITVFNSRTLCGPQRYMVEKALQMKQEGCSAAEILAWLKEAAGRTESFLIPQDFAFLKRGGRLTPVAAALGSVLKLKPVMTLTKDGRRLDKFLVKRTMSAAVAGILSHLKDKKLDARHIIYISHADALEDAKQIAAQIRETFGELEIRFAELSPAFVTQGGPRCIAIQYIER